METSKSPITLSSSRSSDVSSALPHLEYSSKKSGSVITINSSHFERMHLGWKRRNMSTKCAASNKPISNIQKVADWIKSIEESNKYNKKETEEGHQIFETDVDNTQDVEHRGFVVVQCDYMKPIMSQPDHYKTLNTINYTQHRTTCIKKNIIQAQNSSIIIPKTVIKRKHNEADKMIDKVSLICSVEKESYSSSVKLIDEKSDESSDLFELPKSIESRKKELCTYLKLMDPSDKKEILSFQNRRSTRVRNLAALQEKRELEKKIKDGILKKNNNSDKSEQFFHSVNLNQKKLDFTMLENKKIEPNKSNKICMKMLGNLPVWNTNKSEHKLNTEHSKLKPQQNKDLALKSYKELSIQQLESPHAVNDETSQYILESDSDNIKESFYLPFPPKKLTTEIQNFDTIMKQLIPEFKMSERKSKTKDYSYHSFKRKTSKNKENIHSIDKDLAEKKEELPAPSQSTSENYLSKQSGEKLSNKIKHKNKFELLSVRHKNQKLSNGKLNSFNNKLYNVKLRSAKFKIKLKRVPSKRDLLKRKKSIKRSLSKFKVEKKPKHKNQNRPALLNEISVVQQEIEISSAQANEFLEKESEVEIGMDSQFGVGQLKSELINKFNESEKEAIDLQNLKVDINDFNNLSDEHKKCLMESGLFLTTLTETDDAAQVFHSSEELPPLYGFSTSDVNEIKLMCEIFEQSILKHSQKPLKHLVEVNQNDEIGNNDLHSDNILIVQHASFLDHENTVDLHLEISDLKDHNYNASQSVDKINIDLSHNKMNDIIGCSRNTRVPKLSGKTFGQNRYVEIDPNDVEENNCDILPYDRSVEIKSLQKSLNFAKKKHTITSPEMNSSHEWDSDGSPRPKMKRLSHYISISKGNGDILNAFYVDFNLIVCQEFLVSFWMQTPLGNVLGSQDMWIPRGHTQRLVLNNKCIQKESKEMVLCSETNVAYIELWTKEHKSDIREGPVADIFITIYFWKQRQHGIDKKVLQLENINGFTDDVQYCVMKNSPKIIVSWHVASEENVPRRTFVHAYQLAPDYQMVSHISDIEPIDHYVSSLHNIEGGDNLIMGCGEKKITLWNVEYGYKIATIELSDVGYNLSTLWVKCDRGFLFAIQQCGNTELRLIAINGINHSWKKLASYFPPEGFDRLKGICIENGLLLSFYDKGILCWKADTGEPVEEITMETDLMTCGSHVIFVEDDKIFVRHSITFLLSMSVDEP